MPNLHKWYIVSTYAFELLFHVPVISLKFMLSDLEINFWPCRAAVIGKTSKTAVLPSFYKKNAVEAQETYLPA